jgi:para-nitrobenzyl esterase
VGIPYARGPVGSLRWKPAQALPSEAAQQRINATVLAAWCPQLGPLQLTSAATASEYYLVGDEDCLAINVWTPASLLDPAAVQPTLPVLVFVHGGAFVSLSGSMMEYDGLSWTSASSDFILVTFDYRLGILGFFPSPELNAELTSDVAAGVSGNQGFQDQQMALRWLRDKIAAFGGDSGNVIIFGQSAGGLFIYWHLISPQSQGLYHAAIIQTGFSCDVQPSPTSYETSTALGVEFAATINCTQSQELTAWSACARCLRKTSS